MDGVSACSSSRVILASLLGDMNITSSTSSTERRFEIAAGNTSVHVSRRGHGPPVVCLHAVGHGERDFVRLAERLGDRFEIIAFDWPGHGASPPDHVPVTAAHYADVLASVVDGLGLESFTLLGNSIGGAAAIIYATAHPARVTALVLCDPGGLQRVGVIGRAICRHMARFLGAGEHEERTFPRRFRRYYERTVLPASEAAWRREEIIATATAVSPRLREAWTSFGSPDADIRHLPARLACPVLYAWSKGDSYVAWRRSKRAATRAPRHRIELFDGGHAAFLERPQQFDVAFVSFMTGVSR
ncbi:MAG: alpha/beta hydrolase [Kofleriaceae bacterium]